MADPILGLFVTTEHDGNGQQQVYKLDPANGHLSQITGSAYQAWLNGQLLESVVVVEGTANNDTLQSPSGAGGTLITTGNGVDRVTAGAAVDVIGTGLGADRVIYTDPAHLAATMWTPGWNRPAATCCAWHRCQPGQQGVQPGTAAAIQHIDRIDIGNDVAGLSLQLGASVFI